MYKMNNYPRCGEEGEVKGEREVVVEEEEEGEKGERGGDSPAAFRHNERIMADGPRCKRRKQANPRRTNAASALTPRLQQVLKACSNSAIQHS
ncbi:hypothetical protein CHARACLAT_017990 [Characodon lateralis]|uniref:Uncharacterized protein n=1 Tax=Characodon lateralis TaxID=208331 RepID=A0ABU7E1H5_9TELE|nr:hypothetical protein [Characodon lateralis]